METTRDDEELALVCDGLGVDPAVVTRISREPLGSGAVTGFRIDADPIVTAYLDRSLLPVATETGLAIPGQARLWIHPADPHLPALTPAAFGHAAQVLLGRLGIQPVAVPELVAYRPGRRAVLRVDTTVGPQWMKVVRPNRVEKIVRTHTALAEAGVPAPTVTGWAPDGLLVITDAVGVPATEVTWSPADALQAIEVFRATLAAAPGPDMARGSLRDRLPWYIDRVTASLPHLASRLAALHAAVAAAPAEPLDQRTVHGDLHLGQLFFDPLGTFVTGVVDVDTAGLGDPDDDTGAFIGHAIASVLLTTNPAPAAAMTQLADDAWHRWVATPHAASLVAVHLIGHALTAAEAGVDDRAEVLVSAAEHAMAGSSPIRALSSSASSALSGAGHTGVIASSEKTSTKESS